MLMTLTTYNNHSARVILHHAHVLTVPHCPLHAQPCSLFRHPQSHSSAISLHSGKLHKWWRWQSGTVQPPHMPRRMHAHHHACITSLQHPTPPVYRVPLHYPWPQWSPAGPCRSQAIPQGCMHALAHATDTNHDLHTSSLMCRHQIGDGDRGEGSRRGRRSQGAHCRFPHVLLGM
ncbi:hypothetical protein K439DRAFT_1525638, partial [Ramaria rubella]